MCGNFALYSSVQAIKDYYKLLEEIGEVEPREDIRPSMQVPVIVIKQGNRYLGFVKWGLIPYWAKEKKIGYKLFNARSETVDTKPSFKQGFMRRRCLIPANGFYEWRKPDKQKFYLKLKDRELFSFAGIWEKWKSKEGELIPSCTILTCEPNETVKQVHNRMPVILNKEDEDIWLRSTDKGELKSLLKPYPAEMMVIKEV